MPIDVIKAEDIDGYRGDEDLDRILEFIESKPDKDEEKPVNKPVKRSRKLDRKSKRSRTPSTTNSMSKETSMERPREDVCSSLKAMTLKGN